MILKTLRGVIPPVVTIFGSDGQIDYAANRKHLDFLIAHGVHGVAYLGTTGEFGSLTLEEKKDFLKAMADHCAGRIPVLAGVSDTSMKNVIELAQYCETIGIDGLLVLPTYFSIFPAEMMTRFFSAIASATAMPMILYNFPALTGFDMTPEWVENLVRKHENIVGIKETVGDIAHAQAMMKVKQARADFLVFAAYDDQFLKAAQCHMDGFIPASANCFPEASVELWNHPDEKHYAVLIQAMEIYNQTSPLFLGVKEAVYQREEISDHAERLPACESTPEQKEAITELLRSVIKEFQKKDGTDL